ncbi:MAG: chlorite dismutase family protein [Acidimicrobiales bacterium]|nr:chlorite dismutase family protein [Acidimicrobiales bacterium]MCB9395807.1 chlorite dismutase family protein [Acidimicrobiaceae bacterium]
MSDSSIAPVSPSAGLGVIHLFCKPTPMFDGEALVAAVKAAESNGVMVCTVAMLGHKADVAVMAMHADLRELRSLQTGVQRAGLEVVDSYVSLTESSEYAKGLPEEMIRARLYPTIPPEGKDMPAWCFYPMSKKREAHANWFTLAYDDRKRLMHEHGTSGRKFAGRVIQYVTGSAGFDDFEWGVTLFAAHPDDLKEVVYTMRFDEASALYGEFGAFYVGMVTPVEQLIHQI